MTLIRKPMNQNSGCLNTGFKLTAIVIIVIVICVMCGCRTMKEPCGTYSKWESKTKFRSQ